MMRTPLLVFAANVLLWTIQTQLNHYLAPWNISVFIGGLAVVFSSLRLNGRDGARALFLTGLWFDTSSPVPFGLHALLFLFAHAVLLSLRDRLARQETAVGLLVAVIANLGLMLALTIALIHRNPAPWLIWQRVIWDSLVSFALLLILGSWFFALQEHACEIAGISLRREQRSMG